MGTVETLSDNRTHHDIPVHELLLLLGTDRHAGLDESEVSRRLARYGPNELPRTASGKMRRARLRWWCAARR